MHPAGAAGLAYLAGFITVGLVSSWLVLIGVGPGRPAVILLAVALAGATGWWRGRRSDAMRPAAPLRRLETVLLAGLVCAAAVLVWGLVESPLRGNDGTVIWALKAHGLFDSPSVGGPLFRGRAYAATHPDYPILLPSVEAVLSRFLGRYDQSLVDVEYGPLALAYGLAAWGLLRTAVRGWLPATVSLIVITNPNIVDSLTTNLADGPLALLFALAAVCLILWLGEPRPVLLGLAVLFLAAVVSTKNEGLLFACALLVATAVIGRASARNWKHPLAALLVVLGTLLPWRLHLLLAGVSNSDYRFSDLAHPSLLSSRVHRLQLVAGQLAQSTLWHWNTLSWLALAALVVAVLTGGRAGAAWVASWAGLSFGGLLGVYWIHRWPIHLILDTTASRVVASVVTGAAAVSPVFIGRVWGAAEKPRRDRG